MLKQKVIGSLLLSWYDYEKPANLTEKSRRFCKIKLPIIIVQTHTSNELEYSWISGYLDCVVVNMLLLWQLELWIICKLLVFLCGKLIFCDIEGTPQTIYFLNNPKTRWFFIDNIYTLYMQCKYITNINSILLIGNRKVSKASF